MRADGVDESGGWRFARRKGWGVSFAKVALDSVREPDAAAIVWDVGSGPEEK